MGGTPDAVRPRHLRLRPVPPRAEPPPGEAAPDRQLVELIPSQMAALRVFVGLTGQLRVPPAGGLAEQVRTASCDHGIKRWRLHLTQEQMGSMAYGLWLHRMTGSAAEANRFGREYGVVHSPARASGEGPSGCRQTAVGGRSGDGERRKAVGGGSAGQALRPGFAAAFFVDFFAGVLAVFLAAVFFFGISCTSVLPPSPREACALATDASRAAIRSTTCVLGSGVLDAWGGSLPYRFASMTFSSASK
ncbi:DUF6417 family protein [Streptomyces olivochromogenes]|uniref:DUF6417 family protein n=1 Tax=Streptomyces olivochromogenes TaxID=1963 RepID=UPI0036A07312